MMLRGRIPKVNKGIQGRNLQNLHVIPTASVANHPQNQLMPSLIPLISSTDHSRVMNFDNLNSENNDYNFYKGRKRRRQRSEAWRKRDLKHGDHNWNNPYLKPVMCNAKVLKKEAAKEEETEENMTVEEAEKMEKEEAEKVEGPTGSPNEENYFEEVEVASVEADAKQEILVGYRKTKRHYLLKYKTKSFFRPKIFELWERTFVNCLNLQDDIDVDVVSEAEYEYETDHLDRSDSQEMLPKFVEINEEEIHEDSEKAETVETHTEEDMDQEQQTEAKDNGDLSDAKANQLSVNDGNSVSESKSMDKIFKACLKNSNDFMQGKSLIQSSLDSWKSHLIGLEYVIEVQNENKDSALKYYCVLCSEDLPMQNLHAICVINHISSSKHIVKYLEKHFQQYGFKYDENSDYNNDALQKLSEEINNKLGCYFMCVTNLDYYVKNDQEIKVTVENAYHPNEKDLKLDKKLSQKAIGSHLQDEIRVILGDVIEIIEKEFADIGKVDVKESKLDLKSVKGLVPESAHRIEVSQEGKKVTYRRKNTKFATSGSFSKSKGKIGLSSYLKSRYAKARFKGSPSKSSKGLLASNLNVEAPVENIDVPEKEADAVQVKFEVGADVKSTATQSSSSHKNQGKVSAKTTTVHSKYCRKRILGKENSRSKLTTKTSAKDKIVSGVSNKSSVHYKSVTESESCEISKKISENIEGSRHDKSAKSSDHKLSSTQKNASLHKTKDSKSSVGKSTSRHHRTTSKKDSEKPTADEVSVNKNSPSEWRPIVTSKSPAKSPVLGSRSSKSPARKTVRKHSNSPVKRIKSPLRINVPFRLQVGPRRFSKSSRSPLRRKSRSPHRKLSRSPIRRKSRSPLKRRSRSPARRHSRSPFRRHSRSPAKRRSRSPARRRSRSPLRRRSRSPIRRRSRSPIRRRSRSPNRRGSRSPIRRRSRSPIRRRSRSPIRRRSRSPIRRQSRSPIRRQSRSPIRRLSRSPIRRLSRSPLRRLSRSPVRRQSRSPLRKLSKSPVRYRDFHKGNSRELGHRERDHDRFDSKERFDSAYGYDKNFDNLSELLQIQDLENKISKRMTTDKFKSHQFASTSLLEMSDLDPVSDEDESIYFNDKINAEVNLSASNKVVLSKLLQKFSPSDVNSNDPALNKLMQFMESHSAEIQELIGSHSKASNISATKVDSNLHKQNLILQQILLANLTGNNQEQLPSTSIPNLPSLCAQPQPSFSQAPPGFGLRPNIPPPNISQPVQGFFPPNVNVPPPQVNVPAPHMNVPSHPVSGPIPHMNVPPHHVSAPLSHVNIPPPHVNVPPPHIRNDPPPQHIRNDPPQHIRNDPPPHIRNDPPIHIRNDPPPHIRNDPPPHVSVQHPSGFHQLNQPHQTFSPKPNVAPESMFKDLKATVNKLFGANKSIRKQEKIKPKMPGYVTEPDPEKWDLNHPEMRKFNPQAKNIDFGGNPIREEIPVFCNNNNPHGQFYSGRGMVDRPQIPNVPIPPPDAKVSFCDGGRSSTKGNLFPVVNNPRMNPNFDGNPRGAVSDVKLSLAQRLASVLVKVGMIDVPAPLLQEMLMKIGAFSSSPRQDINEAEIISILKRLGYI